MRKRGHFCFLWLAAVCAVAHGFASTPEVDVADLLRRATEAERRHDPEAALDFYRQLAERRPDDAFILQKVAQQISDAVHLDTRAAAPIRQARVREALGFARRAAELDPASAVNQLSLAVLYARLAVDASASEKVEYARLIHRHAEAALALDPGYAWACHILGRWHLEMEALGTTRRVVARLLFGDLPRGSRAEGLRLLARAVELEPDSVVHRVELGIALGELGQPEEAREQLSAALAAPASTLHDGPARVRAEAALQRLNGRR